MTAQLEDRVAAWVQDHPGSTAREVALGVHAAYSRVANVLKSSLFEARPRASHPADRAQGYWLVGATQPFQAETPRDASKTVSATQATRILDVLADGRWHSSAELHNKVFCVLHSRVAELRRRGHRIEHKGGGGGTANHHYRLILQCDVHEVAA